MEILHKSGDTVSQKYRILEVLGEGGIGTTYLAEHLPSNRRVALKVLSIRRLNDWKMMELFEREANTLIQLNHPAIPPYLEYFHADTPSERFFYVVQELARGESLAERVNSGWRASEEEARDIGCQLLETLIYLHELNPAVIHREIKPQNIFITEEGQVFLVDFGAVEYVYQKTVRRDSTIVGTYGYMAPEEFRGKAVPATDLYSLGATLLFLLTQRSPADLPQKGFKIDFRSSQQISSPLATWLEKMLEPEVKDRFASAKEALAVLRGEKKMSLKMSSPGVIKVLIGAGVTVFAALGIVNSFKTGVTYFRQVVVLADKPIFTEEISAKNPGSPDGESSANQAGEKMPRLAAERDGQPEIVEKAIAEEAAVNAIDNEGNTLLHGVTNKDIAIAERLIARGADINAVNNRGMTPLAMAINSQNTDVALLLIAKGADVNIKDSDGNTLLHNLKSKDQALAELLIAKGANVNAKNKAGVTPLESAIASQNQDLTALLIAKGADVNAKDNDGNTLLHKWPGKDIAFAELLIAKGANINAKNKAGMTPLESAIASENTDAALFLIARGADVNVKNSQGVPPLFAAIRNNRKDDLLMLIAGGADVSAKDSQGNTPLHWAIQNNLKDVAEMLILAKADVNAENSQGKTPLDMAIASQNADLISLLIAKGADVNVKNSQGLTPLHWAVQNNRRDAIALLVAGNADVNTKDSQGYTPLHWAIENNRKDLVLLLLVRGADVKAKDKQGYTPLHLAAAKGNTEIASLLIAKDADVREPDITGRTPLHLAAVKGDGHMAALLLAKGAEIDARDDAGETALYVASVKGDAEMAAFLLAKGADVNVRDNAGRLPQDLVAINERMVALFKSRAKQE